MFPFKYKGDTYYDCLSETIENRTSPWCATTDDFDRDKRWAYCMEIKCYRLVSDQKKTYDEARKACLSDGTTLASIQNELEQCKLISDCFNYVSN